jgi:hypothetical protein
MGTEGIWIPLLIGAGTAVSAYGMYAQGQAADEQSKREQELANYNAEIKDREAKALLARSLEEAEQFGEQGRRLQAEQKVSYAKGGVLSSEGTPSMLLEETERNLEADRMKIINEGYLNQSFAQSQAMGMRYEGMSARARGRNAKTGAMIGATGSLLTGLGTASYMSKNMNSGGGSFTPENKATLLKY